MEDITRLDELYNKEVKGLVQKTRDLLRSKYGLWFLGVFSLVDSALGLPITMDPFMAAYILANRSKAFWGFVVTAVGSVLGGIIAYILASYFIDQILSFFSPETQQTFDTLVENFGEGTLAFSFLGAFTPIPYTFIALTAGALKANLLLFVLGSIIGRALRYGIVAYLVYFFGERALVMAKKDIFRISLAVVLLAILFVLYKLYL